MNAQVKMVKNTGILMGTEVGVKALEVLVSVILARYLAPQGFGLMAFAVSFVSLFSIVASFGMNSLVTRNVARGEDVSRYLSNGFIAKAMLSFVALGAISLITWAMGFTFERGLIVFLAALSMVLETYLRFGNAFFRAHQQMVPVAVANLAVHVGSVMTALLVVWLNRGLIEILAARVLVYFVIVSLAFLVIHARLQRLLWSFDPTFTRRMLKASVPFALFQIFVSIYVDIDMVMLSWLKGDVITGWYAAAQKFRKVFTFISSSVSGAIMPAMSQFARESPTNLLETLTRSCKYLVIIALPIAGWICVFADQLVVLLYGQAYQAAIPALRILIWTILFAFLNSALSSALVAVNRERQLSWALGVGALFNILTNLIAIPHWGHVGAAATTLLSEVVVLVFQLDLVRQALPQARPLGQLAKPLWATLAMMAFAWLGRGLELVYTILGSTVIYAAVLVASRAVGRDEWAALNGMLKHKAFQEVP